MKAINLKKYKTEEEMEKEKWEKKEEK
jgi:hypothetical protein